MSAPAAPSRGPIFESLRVRNYRLYAAGQSVSVIGTWMQNIALSWLTLELSHSGTMLGVVTGARYLPLLLFGAWGGLVTDRLDSRRLLIATQAVMAVLSGLLGILCATGTTNLPILIAIVLGLGAAAVFDNPARQSLISELVDSDLIANAIAVNSTMVNTAKLIGPALAGALIATVGVTPCFFVNAVSFATVIASLMMMRTNELYSCVPEIRAPGQIREGVREVLHTPQLLYPMQMVFVTGILTWEFPVSLPLITTYTFHGGPSGYGIAMAFMSVGAVSGGLFAARRTKFTGHSVAISAILWGASVVLAAFAPTLLVEYLALVLVGSGSVTFNSAAKTLLQLESAPRMRGRVMSLWSIGWQGGGVLGAPAIGAIAAGLGPRYGLLVGGIAAAAVGGFALLRLRTVADPVLIATDATAGPAL